MKSQKCKRMIGVILAGGRNRRFGAEKAMTKIGGTRIIDRTIAIMKDIFSENIIIANNEKLYKEFKLKVFPDMVEGKGPMMGIYTALYHSSSDIFITASDMPFVAPGVIKKIINSLDTFDAVISKSDGELHCLHSAYSLNCLQIIKEKMDRGSLKLKDFIEDIHCNVLENFEFANNSMSPFFNMNTQDDLVLAKGWYKSSSNH